MGTQDNGTICWAANGTVSHCRDGDGGYAVIDDNAQDTFNVLMYHRSLTRPIVRSALSAPATLWQTPTVNFPVGHLEDAPEPPATTACVAPTTCCFMRP